MQNKVDPDNLFKPNNFYNLNGAGLGVWLLCLVIGSVFPNTTSYHFRIIALILSLLVAIAFLFKSKKQSKFEYQLLVLFNAGLVFVNASGYNTITYNIPFERKTFHASDSLHQNEKNAGFFSFTEQKDWWPDEDMIYKNDSLEAKTALQDRTIQTLEYQIGFLRDWIQGAIKQEKKAEYDQIRKSIGLVEYDSIDIAILGSSHSKQIELLNKQVDDLKFQLKLKEVGIQIDGKYLPAEVWVDTLYFRDIEKTLEISRLRNKLNIARTLSRIPATQFDSIVNHN